ncbi:regulatory TetR family protein [Kineococcus xinjiangensis]|uniref:Regulatory TetR family protein n=1 Tax=Kineococcus xinjiangensis TaxID=512762 RepID=A0A2S6IH59_9ACTN|nr:TetR family transcriptional regulator [Kineococcus xinjiangensis]PPK93531.1 regulatory TetR family protein [Kineococcus xinjiangensis]
MERDTRADRIADAAIALLARGGARALTHRAVDAEAGLPPGSTSYYARSRAALVAATVDRLVRLDLAEAPPPAVDGSAEPSPGDLTAQLAGLLAHWTGPGRDRHLARYALSLEARRDPGVRRCLDAGGGRLRTHLAGLLERLGADDPERRARWLAAAVDGVLFDELCGWGSSRPLDADGLHAAAADLVAAVLGTTAPEPLSPGRAAGSAPGRRGTTASS